MKDNKMKDNINEVGDAAGGMAGSNFDIGQLSWVKLEQKKNAKKLEYKKHPAKVLNKTLYWDIYFAAKLAQEVQASIEKDGIKVPADFSDALDELITAAQDYTRCVKKYIK